MAFLALIRNLASPNILPLGNAQINLVKYVPRTGGGFRGWVTRIKSKIIFFDFARLFVYLASPNILPLGNAQINLVK